MSGRLAALAGAGAALLAGCAGAPPAEIAASGPSDPARWTVSCTANDEWDNPGPPFRVHGNTYYVGTCGITALLVVGRDGHVLIDGGTEAGAGVIAANIEALGFRVDDVRLLLASHEHFDHVGGLAELQRRSGARLVSHPDAAPVLASGIEAPGDPQAGVLQPFAPAEVAEVLVDRQPVTLGTLALTPHFTPGHTQGALSWQWGSCEGDDCRTIVYADSLSPVSNESYRFSDHPALIADYRAAIDRVGGLECDILLTPHPVASGMHTRLLAGELTDTTACRRFAASLAQRLDARLAEEGQTR